MVPLPPGALAHRPYPISRPFPPFLGPSPRPIGAAALLSRCAQSGQGKAPEHELAGHSRPAAHTFGTAQVRSSPCRPIPRSLHYGPAHTSCLAALQNENAKRIPHAWPPSPRRTRLALGDGQNGLWGPRCCASPFTPRRPIAHFRATAREELGPEGVDSAPKSGPHSTCTPFVIAAQQMRWV